MIIAGASAYPRKINWKKFKDIAKDIGAYLLVDMAHYSGLIAANEYPSPIQHADVVTSTTHKTLRGARSAMILTNNEEIYKKINSAVFPGLQGGPLMHVMAAKAVTFGEALKPEFKKYIKMVISNAKILSDIPFDPNPPKITSGLRFGTPATTSRGFNNKDFKKIGNMIADILDSLLLEESERKNICDITNKKVKELCSKYSIYSEAY